MDTHIMYSRDTTTERPTATQEKTETNTVSNIEEGATKKAYAQLIN